ncbi:MAG: hypothetical protein KAW93_09205 [Methanogenium sp.]|nr:hypothetical protein [Methanogenium sp.]
MRWNLDYLAPFSVVSMMGVYGFMKDDNDNIHFMRRTDNGWKITTPEEIVGEVEDHKRDGEQKQIEIRRDVLESLKLRYPLEGLIFDCMIARGDACVVDTPTCMDTVDMIYPEASSNDQEEA